ncbi:MAG TPA: DNA primase [Bacteroidia bacterium]|nr:DNA primase [Bacteroidia bacterium]
MIPKDTIDKIVEAARVEEVVGDFIVLKKRGANLLGLCPFHGEKTPSFTVSPAKGIYKCFGCGKAGNSVNFIMEHESMTYPEALKYLAKKYNIEVVEKEITPEEQALQNERESLFIVSSFAQKHFSDNLWMTDEGMSVGLSYFRERGFTDETIKKFQLGFSSEERKAFTKAALHGGYKADYLVKTGLSILSDRYKPEEGEIKIDHLFDRYSGRVIFPIHNVTGRPIGFGGRILNNDKKSAKYVNSPQSDIYDKSKVLYGLYFAKKQIVHEDNCFLVEGYTDVISMHQSGIENVVSSSGTSLTVEQIKLIHRFTNNITILYDGDFAGIKASFRGIDLILEEGMNVKVLLFPDGDDPDSYSKKHSSDEMKEFIKKNSLDFIKFKTNLLFEEAKNNPTQKAALIKEIIESIAIVPDAITRNEYITACSNILHTDEQTLVFQVKNIRMKKQSKGSMEHQSVKNPEEKNSNSKTNAGVKDELEKLLEADLNPFGEQEKNLVRLLLNYGNKLIEVTHIDNEGEEGVMEISIAEYVLNELMHDELSFMDPVYQMFLYEFILQMKEGILPNAQYFTNHNNPNISTTAINLIASNHTLSERWKERHNIYIGHETDNLKKTVDHDLYIYKEKRLQKLLRDEKEKLKTANGDEEVQNLLISIQKLDALKSRANKLLGRTII